MSCVLWDIETGQQVRIIINVELHFMINDIFNIFLNIEAGQQVCSIFIVDQHQNNHTKNAKAILTF